jgi:hypothetical protein
LNSIAWSVTAKAPDAVVYVVIPSASLKAQYEWHLKHIWYSYVEDSCVVKVVGTVQIAGHVGCTPVTPVRAPDLAVWLDVPSTVVGYHEAVPTLAGVLFALCGL